MKFALLLLLYSYSAFSALASSLAPDISARSAGMTTYTVTAVDRAYTYYTEAALKKAYGEKNVQTNRHNGIFMSWTITSPNSQLQGTIEALQGVHKVKIKHEPRDDTHDSLAARGEAGSNVWLSYEAKQAVENHEGVKGVSEESEAIPHDGEDTLPSEAEHDAHLPRSLAANEESSSDQAREELGRRDVPYYSCFANTTDIQKTEEFLTSKIQQGTKYYQLRHGDELVGWYNLYLDDGAKKEVEAYEGISSLKAEGKKIKEFRVLPHNAPRSQPMPEDLGLLPLPKVNDLTRRAGTWEKQQGADKALRMDSQYNGANLDDLSDYVYRSESGEGVTIYVIDRGVRAAAYNVKGELEFHPPQDDPFYIRVLQSDRSKDAHQDKYSDDSVGNIHGTGVAARALGGLYGIAKKATLVSVKGTFDLLDLSVGLGSVLADLKQDARRQKTSVVVISAGWHEDDRDTHDKIQNDRDLQKEYGNPLRAIMNLGVPIVCASGNDAEQKGRENIDTMPAIFQDNDAPLINVGAADYKGKRASFSQGGSQLTIYAPGVDIKFPSNNDLEEKTFYGTSLAAPQVAGVIATYLSYKDKPWGNDDSLSGIDRVKAIRDYLTSDASSWPRQQGIRMIWNGAKKEDHESAGANAAKPPLNTTPKDPTPPTPASPPKPQKSMALGIVFSTRITKFAGGGPSTRDNRWIFFTGKPGVSSVCYKQVDNKYMYEVDKKGDKELVYDPGWPVGTWPIRETIDNMRCTYMNDGKGNPGALWCEKRDGPIECFEEHKRTAKDGVTECERSVPGDTVLRRPVVYCEW